MSSETAIDYKELKNSIEQFIKNELKNTTEFRSLLITRKCYRYLYKLFDAPTKLYSNLVFRALKQYELDGNIKKIEKGHYQVLSTSFLVKRTKKRWVYHRVNIEFIPYLVDIEDKFRYLIGETNIELFDKLQFLKLLPDYDISKSIIEDFLRKIVNFYVHKGILKPIKKGKSIFTIHLEKLPKNFFYPRH